MSFVRTKENVCAFQGVTTTRTVRQPPTNAFFQLKFVNFEQVLASSAAPKHFANRDSFVPLDCAAKLKTRDNVLDAATAHKVKAAIATHSYASLRGLALCLKITPNSRADLKNNAIL